MGKIGIKIVGLTLVILILGPIGAVSGILYPHEAPKALSENLISAKSDRGKDIFE